MPNGFRGEPARKYLTIIEESLTEAIAVHNEEPFRQLMSWNPAPPRLPERINVQLPYSAVDANIGNNGVGIGTSDNIVSNYNHYNSIYGHIDGVNVYIIDNVVRIAEAIEELCEIALVMPRASAKLIIIVRAIKTLKGEFDRLTEEYKQVIQDYSAAMPGNRVIWNRVQAEATRNECEAAMRRQIRNMEDTEAIYRRIVSALEESESSENVRAMTATRRETTISEAGISVTTMVPDEMARAAARTNARAYREQAGLLGNQRLKITAAIGNLEENLRLSQRKFTEEEDNLRRIDNYYANQMAAVIDRIDRLTAIIMEICNSFDATNPDAAPSDLLRALDGAGNWHQVSMITEAYSDGAIAQIVTYDADGNPTYDWDIIREWLRTNLSELTRTQLQALALTFIRMDLDDMDNFIRLGCIAPALSVSASLSIRGANDIPRSIPSETLNEVMRLATLSLTPNAGAIDPYRIYRNEGATNEFLTALAGFIFGGTDLATLEQIRRHRDHNSQVTLRLNLDGYLVHQNSAANKKIKYGIVWPGTNNTCGPIAAFNVLRYLDLQMDESSRRNVPIADIIEWLERTGNTNVRGIFGTNPRAYDGLLAQHNVRAETIYADRGLTSIQLDILAQRGDAFLINTVNIGGITSGAHVVFARWDPSAGQYTFYNVRNRDNDTRIVNYPSIQEYLDEYSSSLISITTICG